MTLLDVLSRCRQSEAVFRRYEAQAEACLCCEALFDTLEQVAEKYHLDLGRLLDDLQEMLTTEAPPDGVRPSPHRTGIKPGGATPGEF